MKRWRLVVAGSACYLLALVAMAPAALLDPLLQRASAQRLRLADAHGTLWSGRATVLLTDSAGRRPLTWPLRWRFLPGALLQGYLACQIELVSGAAAVSIALHHDRIEIRNAEIDAPAAVLGSLLPALAQFEFGGTLHLSIASLVWRGDDLSVAAALRWREASTPQAGIAALGEYYFSYHQLPKKVELRLHTVAGALRVDGQGSWTTGASPVFQVLAQIAPQYQERLEPLLKKLTAVFAAGRFAWRLQ